MHIELNKTYYLYKDNSLRTFRILAISYKIKRGLNYSFAHDTYLVQFPNEEPRWIEKFLSSACVFKNKNDIFEYAMGNDNLNINKYNKNYWTTLEDLMIKNTNLLVNSFGDLETNWKWDSSSQKPRALSTEIRHILYVNDTFHICVEQDGYLTKEECYKNHFDGLTIEEFVEEPFELNINIKVLPNESKIHTLHFVEV
jgi:hypothetical protein